MDITHHSIATAPESNGIPHIAAITGSNETTAPAISFSVDSQTTPMGHRSHTVITKEQGFAYALYEQALEIDIEPDFVQSKGLWSIGFICDDHERDMVLTVASASASASGVTA
ncbi:hypothetical protein EON80_25160 [bacterium]|nr:MAG: hypothetical protein EON80_25160 [bacterium]